VKEKKHDEDFRIQSYRKKERTEILYVRLTEDVAKKFRQIAEDEAIPISELMGQMITFCLDRYKKVKE
jgi:hypothetical protein